MERSYESAAALVGQGTGPLSEHLGSFVGALIRQQYVPAVVYVKALHALALDRWMANQHVVLADLTEAQIERFQRRRRRCRGGIRAQTKRAERRNVIGLLQYLRGIGACRAAARISTPAEDLAAAYERHLRQQQGLATSSIERYGDIARQFLAKRFGRGWRGTTRLPGAAPQPGLQDG